MKMTNPTTTSFQRTLLLSCALIITACGGSDPQSGHHERASESGGHETEIAKGPHGGRLLQDGAFALELSIFERGVPPEFRFYPTQNGKPLALQDVQVTVDLHRINGIPGGATDRHVFTPKDGYLRSGKEVYEPHSFAVKVTAQHAGKTHSWTYDSPEGQVSIAADMAAAAGMQTGIATGGVLHETVALFGSIQPNPEHMRDVSARFPGIVRNVNVQVGDTVKQHQALATIESNESLQLYTLSAPIAGVIIARNTNAGEAAGSEPLFEIADFSNLRAELNVFPRDRARLKPGQATAVTAADGVAKGSGKIDSIAPIGNAHQAQSARVLLDNSQSQWTPGRFVNASITVGETPAALLVPAAAVQRFRDWDVVFVNEGDRYQAQPVELGRRDGDSVEVLGGLAAGARIVTRNSYLVKADIEKSGAAHDH